jgi:hypothetical protein
MPTGKASEQQKKDIFYYNIMAIMFLLEVFASKN